MKQPLAALLLALAVALPCHAAATAPQWECLETDGTKVVQDHPCTQADPEFSAESVPSYVWAIIAVLGLVWLKVLMPDRVFRRGGATPSVMPQPQMFVADGPSFGEAPKPRPAPPRPQPAAAAPKAGAEWSLDVVRGLESMKLALLIQGFWRARSCTVDFAGQSAGGTDLMIYRPSTGRLFAIAQCASMRSGTVGIERLHQLWELVEQHQAALGLHYGAAFSDEAQAFVKGKRLKLIAAADLLSEITALPAEQQASLLASVSSQI